MTAFSEVPRLARTWSIVRATEHRIQESSNARLRIRMRIRSHRQSLASKSLECLEFCAKAAPARVRIRVRISTYCDETQKKRHELIGRLS